MCLHINIEMSHWHYVGVSGALCLPEPGPALIESPPDDEIEGGEDDEGRHGGHDDPGPGAVPHRVVLTQSQLGRFSVMNQMFAAATTGEVHAVGHCLSLEELAEVEEAGEADSGEDVAVQGPPAGGGGGQHPDKFKLKWMAHTHTH